MDTQSITEQVKNIFAQKISINRIDISQIADYNNGIAFCVKYSGLCDTVMIPSCVSILSIDFRQKKIHCVIEKQFLL